MEEPQEPQGRRTGEVKTAKAKANFSYPNKGNFCGGNFQDWIEVNLTDRCNGKCSWCIEKEGWHPKTHAPWEKIVATALNTGKTNVILLGGEPTLHPDLPKIIAYLVSNGKKAWITTNGGKLTPDFVRKNLVGVHGVNISIHDFDLQRNQWITGINLQEDILKEAIEILHEMKATVRLNCNCIQGHIDSEHRIHDYLAWAKKIKADKVRFAELKLDTGAFVDLAKILHHQYGLNDEPFSLGCNKDAVVDGMPVNFRQMCGFQTPLRYRPPNPRHYPKQVVYYDGKLYNGWQTKGEVFMKKPSTSPACSSKKFIRDRQVSSIFAKLRSGKIDQVTAEDKLSRIVEDLKDERDHLINNNVGDCRY